MLKSVRTTATVKTPWESMAVAALMTMDKGLSIFV